MSGDTSIRFSSILGNSQKLDGGAMYGNAPKALWSRWSPPDELNRIDLACRALLVETEHHKILFETGIGAYMEPKHKQRFGVQEDHHVLVDSLAALSLEPRDITEVVLSHLHFDHAGGLLTPWREDAEPELIFTEAQFYAGETAWQRARHPHPRDRASFVPRLNDLLEASGRLHLLKPDDVLSFDGLDVRFYLSEGHTPGMLCSDLRWPGGRLVFAADLIPGRPWVHLPITMGYDRYPEKLIDEKKKLLTALAADRGWLFFTHDPGAAAAKVAIDPEKGKYGPAETRDSLTRTPLTA